MNIKPCPCGAIPESLGISADYDNPKWATAFCPECGLWGIEFRCNYHPVNSEEAQLLAVTAWNNAPRKEDEAT